MDFRSRAPGDAGRPLPGWPSRLPSAVPSTPPSRSGLLAINARYFMVRALIFGVVLAVVLRLGVKGFLAFAVAFVLSGLVSYPVALRQRRAVFGALAQRRGWLR
ncbi:hypothetical protein [Frankia sp. CiP3]|uniref:hypothetical protein n=1 Tax=Frankia sp. CiP3 TaxID=2880971 RepID=UPI0027E1F83E|nr:hypothetical protein [Frankia sp. CiP3]